MPDWQVWSILVALGPVACMGGGLLGVLTGRWLRFPGAPAVMVVVVLVIDMVGSMPFVDGASLSSGSGCRGRCSTQAPRPTGLPPCSPATPASTWSTCSACAAQPRSSPSGTTDRSHRSAQGAIAGVVVIGLAALALAMTAGNDDNQSSKPIPYQVSK